MKVFGFYRSSVEKMYMLLYLHREEYDIHVEGKRFVTICNLLRSTRKKGRRRMNIYLENNSTTVICKQRKLF